MRRMLIFRVFIIFMNLYTIPEVLSTVFLFSIVRLTLVISIKYFGDRLEGYLSFLKGICFHFQLLGSGFVNWLRF